MTHPFDGIPEGERMRRRFMILLFVCVAMVLTACNRSGNPDEAAQVDSVAREGLREQGGDARRGADGPASSEGRGNSRASAEEAYDVATIRIANDREIATDRCDLLTGSAVNDCKELADRDRDASSTQARKQRDLSRR